MANSVAFDAIKILNKMEEDKNLREERQLKIAEEIKREQAIAAAKGHTRDLEDKKLEA